MKKVILFFADGTEEVEALTAVDILRRAGAEVTVAGLGGVERTGAHGITVKTDVAAEELCGSEAFDMVVLPGGMPGTTNLGASEKVRHFIIRAINEDKFIGAICAAPTILGGMGLLKNRSATCYPGMESGLGGALYTGGDVCRDGKIITGAGVGAAVEFSLALTEALFGFETAGKIRKSIVAD